MKVADVFADLHINDAPFMRELNKTLATAARRDVTIKVKMDGDRSAVASLGKADKTVQSLQRSVGKATTGINTFSGRISVMADALLTLGPAAVPLTAVAIPAVAAMGVALSATAVAAGTAVLAFQGVGTALTALNKSALDPSAANLQATQLAMEKLSPAAQTFTKYLFSLRGEVDKLRSSAAEGLFPGAQAGLQALTQRLPEVNALLHSYGTILGGIAARTGEALASERWDNFFTMLKTSGGPALNSLADAALSVAHGFGEILVAFAPLSQGGFDWVAQVASDFDDWATSLSGTQGFRDFVAYVQQVGPQIVDLVVALGEAFIAVSKAAGPLGGVVLKSLTVLADILARIADSPVGPVLIAAAIGMRLFARASQLAAPAIAKVSETMLDLRTSPNVANTALQRLKGGVKGLAGPAGFVGLSIAATSTNDALNVLGTTASGALIGFSAGGPVGAAIGAGAGLIAGIGIAALTSDHSLKDFIASLTVVNGALDANSKAAVANKLAHDGVLDSVDKARVSEGDYLKAILDGGAARKAMVSELNAIIEAHSHVVQTGRGAAVVFDAQGQAAKDALGSLGEYRGGINGIEGDADQAAGALDAYTGGLSAADAAQKAAADSAAGLHAEVNSFKGVLASFNSVILAGLQSRVQLKQSFRDLNKEIKEGKTPLLDLKGDLFGYAQQAIATAGSVAEMTGSTEAGNAVLRNARKNFIEAGTAAGMHAGHVKDLAKQIFRLPDKKSPKIEIKGMDTLLGDMQTLLQYFGAIPANVNTTVTTTFVSVGTGPFAGKKLPVASGGAVFGPGGPRDDAIPAMLSNGEYVINAASAKRIGYGTLNRINQMAGGGLVQRFAGGGLVKAVPKRLLDNFKRLGFKIKGATATPNKSVLESGIDANSVGGAVAALLAAAGYVNREGTIFAKPSPGLAQARRAAAADLKEEIATNKKTAAAAAKLRGKTIDEQIASLQKDRAKTTKYTDEWVAFGEQIKDLRKTKSEALADFRKMISGSEFGGGSLASQFAPGADFGGVIQGVVDQAKGMRDAGVITKKAFGTITAAARAAASALAPLQKQYDALTTSTKTVLKPLGDFVELTSGVRAYANLPDATDELERQRSVLESVQQEWEAIRDTISESIVEQSKFGDASAAQNIEDAQAVYDATVKKYGAGSANAVAAKKKLNDAAPTAGGIIAGLQKRLAQVKSFAANIKTLQGMGLGRAALKEILAMGPIAGAPYAEALTKALPGEITAINDLQQQFASVGSDLGVDVANLFKGADLQAAQVGVDIAAGIVKGLQDSEKDITDEMTRIGVAMANALAAALGIHSPSKVFADIGMNTLAGMQQGLKAEVPNTIGVMDGLSASIANAAPASAPAAPAPYAVTAAPPSVNIEHVHVRETVDLGTLTQRLTFWARSNGRTR